LGAIVPEDQLSQSFVLREITVQQLDSLLKSFVQLGHFVPLADCPMCQVHVKLAGIAQRGRKIRVQSSAQLALFALKVRVSMFHVPFLITALQQDWLQCRFALLVSIVPFPVYLLNLALVVPDFSVQLAHLLPMTHDAMYARIVLLGVEARSRVVSQSIAPLLVPATQ
jgi:hypothetical protein